MIDVYYLSLKEETPHNGYWDYGFLNDFIEGRMWQPPSWTGFKTHEVKKLPQKNKAIVIVPARHHAEIADKVIAELQKINHVVLFLMGDEEADFPVEEIKHKSKHIWVQNPHPNRHDNFNKLGTGYPPACTTELAKYKYKKDLNVYFSGQITHSRRIRMIEAMREYELFDKNTNINKTKGFTQGVSHKVYFDYMSKAKFVPCPSGAVIPDSFRLFESLEAMAVPIADEVNPTGTIESYWDWLFDEVCPFPKIKEWSQGKNYIIDNMDQYEQVSHRITAWWIRYKRNFAYKVLGQLNG